ncbi:MAG: aminotransferase class I/II-fold pyridoxal phosphate-dependent enzyme [Paenibacillus sp.]|jgi:arginine/lysine/ornithine decarboxylase|uniref:aminotransferase class I/II-fold pyridoxal phosphate-dependent enzyme n=1 Tax=Paenibacillus sp. GCM10012303 TaxID=3317340 RepID=UPI0029E894B0|nr:aminotransferase class I/II-fold pyridoxal phosphate-dependent enzyme [Paenibacillus sp.]
MKREDAPLLEALLTHSSNYETGFHVPGHRSGRGLQPEAYIFQDIMKIDLTELTGLDDLHDPEGPILQAQQLAAQCFGAEATFFLVNGSTVGNLAAVLTLCSPDDIVIVQRNVHKSILHGLMLAGARAVFVQPLCDEASELPAGVRLHDVETALQQYPEATGVIVTNPNYYGMGIDLTKLADLVHAYGKPLVVDEAHGAHYGFHPDLPQSALAGGADVVIQSTHKMLTALTMGAMLHVQGPRVDRELLKQRLAMLQSSSPSYPIMASLDASRRLLHTEGTGWISRSLQELERLELAIRRWPWYRTLQASPSAAYESKDPFKVTVSDVTGTLDGFMLRRQLEGRGLMCEMADPRHVLLVFSLSVQKSEIDALLAGLEQIAADFDLANKLNSSKGEHLPADRAETYETGTGVSEPVPFRMAKPGHLSAVPVSEASGFVSGEMIIPYPPGIPILYPGERITEQSVRVLTELAYKGAKFQGAADPKLRTIQIVNIR